MVKIAGYSGKDVKSSDFPGCNALLSNISQERQGTSLKPDHDIDNFGTARILLLLIKV